MDLFDILPQVSIPQRDGRIGFGGYDSDHYKELGAKKGKNKGFLVNGQ